MTLSVTAYIALGSNLGDRRANLVHAIDRLHTSPGGRVTDVSPLYETEPVGGPADQPPFLNAAVRMVTTNSPAGLLQSAGEIESALGRVRTVPDGPRTIDVDVLLYGDLVMSEAALTIPHARMHLRTFVIVPLCDIAKTVRHPVLGKTIGDIAGDLGCATGVVRVDEASWFPVLAESAGPEPGGAACPPELGGAACPIV